MQTRPPLPPFTRETAAQKVRLAENGWNSRDPVTNARQNDSSVNEPVKLFGQNTADIEFTEVAYF